MEFKGIYPALQDEDCMMKIVDHVTTGGSVVQLAQLWEVPYRVMIRFLRSDPIRTKQYADALEDRKEWAIERLLSELRHISCVDMTEILDENGCIKNTDSWPEDAKQNLKKIVVKELFDSDGNKKGELKNVEFHDKLKAIDMYGKQLKMWSDDKSKDLGDSIVDLLAEGVKSRQAKSSEPIE